MASTGIQVPGSYEVPDIPYGFGVFRTLPYAFIPLELLFGAWVWILVAATKVFLPIVQGWVMYVSVSSFFFSLLLLMVYVFGFHRNHCNTWKIIDVIYHGISAAFYLSAAVLQAYATINCDQFISLTPPMPTGLTACNRVIYHLDAAATFFAFLTSLLYMLHSFHSYVRWNPQKSEADQSVNIFIRWDDKEFYNVTKRQPSVITNFPNILDFVYFSFVFINEICSYSWCLHTSFLILIAMNGEVCLVRQAS